MGSPPLSTLARVKVCHDGGGGAAIGPISKRPSLLLSSRRPPHSRLSKPLPALPSLSFLRLRLPGLGALLDHQKTAAEILAQSRPQFCRLNDLWFGSRALSSSCLISSRPMPALTPSIQDFFCLRRNAGIALGKQRRGQTGTPSHFRGCLSRPPPVSKRAAERPSSRVVLVFTMAR